MLEQLDQHIQNAPLFALLLTYLGGVLTSFTPCVFPVIPITVGVLGIQKTGSKMTAFIRSLIYVLGMAVVYAILGMIAAATGVFFGKVSVHPFTNLIVANVLMIFALSMLDAIHIPLPSFLTNRKIVSGEKRGLLSIFIMGALSGTVVAPCTAPVLATILAYVGSTQNMFYGALLLFLYAFGLGTLLMIIGTFSGVLTSLSKGGKIMQGVKIALGIFMILVAEYFLVRAGTLLY